jgi:RNA polymerase sigma-70 factor (ECF subfamily)
VPSQPGEVTNLLAQIRRGDREAETKLIPLVYNELRRLAGYYLSGERPGHTLQPTALVHEAYLRLTQLKEIDWQSSSHFFAISAQMMRRILIDHARAHISRKRGGNVRNISLDDVPDVSAERSRLLLALEDALLRLAELDLRQSHIVELRYFGGLTEEEAAVVLCVSTRTVKRDWRLAKAWLYQELSVERPD